MLLVDGRACVVLVARLLLQLQTVKKERYRLKADEGDVESRTGESGSLFLCPTSFKIFLFASINHIFD